MAMTPIEIDEQSTYITLKPTYCRDDIVFRKKNGVVTVNFSNVLQNIPAGSMGTVVAVGGIPEGYRPNGLQTITPGWLIGNAQVRFELYTDGHITGYNYGSAMSGNNMFLTNTISYVANDATS